MDLGFSTPVCEWLGLACSPSMSGVLKLMVRHAESIEQLIMPTVTGLGYELVGCEFLSGNGQSTVRVYIDHPNGVTVADCAKTSRQISAVLDVEDPVMGRYLLEVSSPGINRPLFTLAQFAKVTGSKVFVKLRSPVSGRKQWTGILSKVEQEQLQITCEETVLDVPFNDIETAHVCYEKTN